MDAELERWKAAGQLLRLPGLRHLLPGRRPATRRRPELLLIHGYPFNSFDWSLIWPTLVERFTVIAPDMIGMGFSDKPVAYGYSVPDHADVHEALLEHLNVDSCHVLAHDLGDSVGQELLARHEFGEQSYGSLRYRVDHLAQRRPVQRGLHAAHHAEADVGNAVGGHHESAAGQPLSRRILEPTINEMFGPNTKPSRRADGEIPPDPRIQRRQAGAA